MSTEKDNSMNGTSKSASNGSPTSTPGNSPSKDERHDSASKNPQHSDNPKFDRQSQSGDDDKRNVDTKRHPEEQVVNPKEYTKKDDSKSNDKSARY